MKKEYEEDPLEKVLHELYEDKKYKNCLEVFRWKNRRKGFGIKKMDVCISFRKEDAEYIVDELKSLLKR